MKRYMGRRILFSVFSLIVVVAAVMLLVYSLINRNVIFQQDDMWNKKSSNDRTIYEYTMYSKYGYLDYVDYSAFLKAKYESVLGSDYTKDAGYKADKDAIQDEHTYLENASECAGLFGYPHVTLAKMIDWQAEWILEGGRTLNKPTHFEQRKGSY